MEACSSRRSSLRRALCVGLVASAAVPASGFVPCVSWPSQEAGVGTAASVGAAARRPMPTRLLKIRARMSFPSFPGGDEMAEELKNSLGRFVKSTAQGLPRALDTASLEVVPLAKAVILQQPLKEAREAAALVIQEREEREAAAKPAVEDNGALLEREVAKAAQLREAADAALAVSVSDSKDAMEELQELMGLSVSEELEEKKQNLLYDDDDNEDSSPSWMLERPKHDPF